MSGSDEPAQRFHNVVVPTDLDDGSEVVFAHALKVVLTNRGRLTLVHASSSEAKPRWNRLPTVRALLTAWGALPPDATVERFSELGITVRIQLTPGDDAATAVTEAIGGLRTDLLVMGTHRRSLLEQPFQNSVAETIARRTGHTTLFLRVDGRPLLDIATGTPDLTRVLVPWSDPVHVDGLIALAHRFARSLGCERDLHTTLLHVGPEQTLDVVAPDGVTWGQLNASGLVVPAILDSIDETDAQLVIMATRGRDNLMSILRGSRTEQVLRRAMVPVLAVPLRD